MVGLSTHNCHRMQPCVICLKYFCPFLDEEEPVAYKNWFLIAWTFFRTVEYVKENIAITQ